jgi:beta-lactam-binding protein with PASTA domain
MTGSEYRNVKRRSSSTATLVGIFAVVAFILVLFVVFILPSLVEWIRPASDEQITIPDVVGELYDAVRNSDDFFEMFRFEANFIPSEDVPEGHIISQRPLADTSQSTPIGGGRILIRVDVSSGPLPPNEMPNFIGRTWTDARRELNRLNLDLDIREEAVEDDRPLHEVIETDPPAGSLLARGDIIIIRYSTGPARTVEVPTTLRGGTEAFVMEQLRDLGLNPRVERREHSDNPNEPAGTVIFVQHEGQRVPTGTEINIHVSQGPAPPPPPTEPPPTDPPPTEPPPTDPPPLPTIPPDTGDGGDTGDGSESGGGDG